VATFPNPDLRLLENLESLNHGWRRVAGDPLAITGHGWLLSRDRAIARIIHSFFQLFWAFERPSLHIPFVLNGGQFSSQETMQEALEAAWHIVPR